MIFWVLTQSIQLLDSDSVYGTISGYQNDPIWKNELCSDCGRLKSSRQINNLGVVLYGTLLLDFVWLDNPSIIISNSLKNKLSKSDLKGFGFRGIDISGWRDKGIMNLKFDEKSNDEHDLYQLVIEGKGGSLIPQNNMIIKSKCNTCEITTYEPLGNGIIVDIAQWDKSDIFYMKEYPGLILMTDGFLNFLIHHNITGYHKVDSTKFSMLEVY